MNVFQIKQGRYLLYLDILGFREMVRSNRAEVIYETIDNLIEVSQQTATRIEDFGVLYFSDTILFYQKPQGWGSWAFSDIYTLSGLIWSTLAAKGIPSRGAISFGEFNVQRDSSDSHNLFWGEALIKAYDVEQAKDNRNFIGITLSSEAWQAVEYMEEGVVRMLTNENVFKDNGNEQLRLNPFWHLRHMYNDHLIGEVDAPYTKLYSPNFSNELKALAFVMENNKRNSDFAKKYKYTSGFFKEIISPEALQWYLSIYRKELAGA